MKKTVQIIGVLMAVFIVAVGNAQIVDIPDSNFKTRLLSSSSTNNVAKNASGVNIKIDSNNDGEIQVSEALAVFELRIPQAMVTDLTGIAAFTNLQFLQCSANNITELDLSENVNLKFFWTYANPNLSYINIKSGSSLDPSYTDEGSWWETWMNLPEGVYICADVEEIPLIEPYLVEENLISEYCTFYPGGNYNTITGTVRFDSSGDGLCSELDTRQPLVKINISNGIETHSFFTTSDGEYVFFTQDGDYELSAQIENPDFFNITPETGLVIFPLVDGSEEEINFCVTPEGVHKDLEVVIYPVVPARTGFSAQYKIVYRNKGNQVMSLTNGITFSYDDNVMDFTSSSVVPSASSTGHLAWNYNNLLPLESREIFLTMQINAPTHPDYPVNIDDVFVFEANSLPVTDDENPDDNTFVFNQMVVGSYDPNDITCVEGDVVGTDYIGKDLHYVIRFENTGTDYAERIVVIMEIDQTKYDVSSIQLLSASHEVITQVIGNEARFFFEDIHLNSGGHGNILLVINSNETLSEGDFVQSKADIYFDYNYPIITNDAVTTFEANMNIDENPKNIELKFYPNPTTDYFNISSQIMIQSMELYDISGRLVKTSLVNSFEAKQNISNLINGIYILKIKTEKGEVTGKIVKK